MWDLEILPDFDFVAAEGHPCFTNKCLILLVTLTGIHYSLTKLIQPTFFKAPMCSGVVVD